MFTGAVACSTELRPPKELIYARFDPEEGVLPTPTDILRDEKVGKLDLDADDPELSPAEAELYRFLNTLDGWLPTSTAEVEFTGAVAEHSITADTVQIWQLDASGGQRLDGLKPALDRAATTMSISPPEGGWARGATIAVVVRGGDHGLVGQRGERVTCDATFYYLRLDQRLDDPVHHRAFPGATRAERLDKAADLEPIRRELAPYFDLIEHSAGIPRAEVAALWTFTVSDRTEVAIDPDSGEVPLPIDLLLDHQTGRIDLPVRDGDTDYEVHAKESLRGDDGFGTTMNPLFRFTAPVDRSTVNATTVALYRIGPRGKPALDQPAERIPIKVELADDLQRVELQLLRPPLEAQTTYAVVVRPEVHDLRGVPVVAPTVGHFLRADQSLLDGDRSTVGSLSDEDARKLEPVRARLDPLLDELGRDRVAVAWPYTTMSIVAPLREALTASARLGISPDPQNVTDKSTPAAILDFPLGIATMLRVKRVFYGTITTADFLDPLTRDHRPDGSHRESPVRFVLTIPYGAEADKPLPVVIFGHAIITERRFLLALADALAARGFAAISIDLPYHGERSHCAANGPVCMPDPLSSDGKMICPSHCPSGSHCVKGGGCVDAAGQPQPLGKWPIIPFYQASGAAFIDVEDIPATRHHFSQAITDLGALTRSLSQGNWKKAVGYSFDREQIHFLGQSLGGIVGGTYVAVDRRIKRAVLNVPGANLLPMFLDSTYFKGHIDAFLARHEIEKHTAEYQRFINIARWFTDAVDPLNVAQYLLSEQLPGAEGPPERAVMIQMATLDFIIPNNSTEYLAEVAKVPRRDYTGEHAFLVIPVEPAYLGGVRDAADFLAGKLDP